MAHILRVLVEAGVDKLLELLGVVAGELRRVVLRDEEQHAHGVQVAVGRLALGQLDRRDAQGPDVRLHANTQSSALAYTIQCWQL